ncbi:MAG: GNAT family N-acetyltransferase [Planctomycetota bacterium]|jgi:ribosomal-protein-alanine N-acetyltransferase
MYRKTARLILRDDRPDEAETVVAVWTDAKVMRHMGGVRDPERVRRAFEEGLDSNDPLRFWAVEEQATGRRIGECGLIAKQVEGRDEVELVYVLARDAWGNGYATEAAAAVCAHAKEALGLARLIALIHPENTASVRVAEKAGFLFERAVERHVERDGGHRMHLYVREESPR